MKIANEEVNHLRPNPNRKHSIETPIANACMLREMIIVLLLEGGHQLL